MSTNSNSDWDLIRQYLEGGDALALRTLQLKPGPFSELAARLESAEMQKAAFEWECAQRRRISEGLYKAVETAANLSEYKSTFLANMSHELRTPLNGVIGVMRLLMDTPLDRQQREYAQIVQTSAQSLLAVVNEILDYSKIEAGRMSIELMPFDLRSAIEEAADLLAPQAAQKGLTLICDFDPRIGSEAISDPVRVRQIALNLIGNAIKFTHEGSVIIRLNLAEEPFEGIRLEVEDTGIGIHQSAFDRIFEGFTQADGGTTRRYGGTGLGLTICRTLAELLGGQLGFESEVGKGSRFWCDLPMEVELASEPKRMGQVLALISSDAEFEAVSRNLSSLGFEARRWDSSQRPATDLGCSWFLAESGAIESAKLQHLISELGPKLVLVRSFVESSTIEHDTALVRPVHASRLRRFFCKCESGILNGKRLAIVDDDRIAMDLIARALRASGAEVIEFTNPADLDALSIAGWDAVLVDLLLEGCTALDVRNRWLGQLGDAKWFATSASFSSDQRSQCLAAGFVDCLTKPVSAEALVRSLSPAVVPLTSSPLKPRYYSPLDPSHLEWQFDGDRSAVADVLSKFATSSSEAFVQMEKLAKAGDAAGVVTLAHRLVGMSRTVGSESVVDVALAIESKARTGDCEIAELLAIGRDSLVQVSKVVDAYRKRAA